ncbi:hypothetical protein ACIBI9_21025 [Nonomuraea sp. NPDC050451]|uniref:hypothetical protein n=1 Tax=Nonomuraea sp. NPDC050451 TaxID=3364364 RepID=UPI003795FC53
MDAHITNEPARARTDTQVLNSSHYTGAAPAVSESAIRRAGIGLMVGSLTWATAIFIHGTQGVGVGERIIDLTGLAFQLGIFCLLWAQMKTRAIGTSRAAAVALRIEATVLGLAGVWSLLHGVLPDDVKDATWLAFLDICWPLSMLGMAAISVKLATTARWRGVLRWWPLIAESWAVVTVPCYVLVGEQLARWVGGTHLVIGYATLGLLMALRPAATLFSRSA